MSDAELIAAWLDGSADDAACAALLQRLDADPALLRGLIDGARDEVLLGLALGRSADLTAQVLAGLRSRESRTRLHQSVMGEIRARQVRRRWRRLGWLAMAAGIAVALALAWPRPVPGPTIVATAGAVVEVGSVPLSGIASLEAGR